MYNESDIEPGMLFNRINLFRQERGLSRKELAELVGVNPQTIGYLERGDYRPTVELALKLAQAFGVSVETLFALEPFPSLAEQLDRRVAKETNHD
jgi:DNA-binding XRE family transcriptional regulator